MKVRSASNSVFDREYTVPSGGLAPSSNSIRRSYLRCGASVVALALLKTSAKLWYWEGTPDRLGESVGGAVEAERSFASSGRMYSVKFVYPESLQARATAAVPMSETSGADE